MDLPVQLVGRHGVRVHVVDAVEQVDLHVGADLPEGADQLLSLRPLGGEPRVLARHGAGAPEKPEAAVGRPFHDVFFLYSI